MTPYDRRTPAAKIDPDTYRAEAETPLGETRTRLRKMAWLMAQLADVTERAELRDGCGEMMALDLGLTFDTVGLWDMQAEVAAALDKVERLFEARRQAGANLAKTLPSPTEIATVDAQLVLEEAARHERLAKLKGRQG